MSRGIAHGSADGPRMIYGRENVNWGGPKKAGDIDNINDNPMDDYGDDHTEIKTDIETQIEDLQELYPEDEMLQKYGKLTDHFTVQQSLRHLHELFPSASLDNDTSPLRAGKIDFTKGSIRSGMPSDLYFEGSQYLYSKTGTLDTESALTSFSHLLEQASQKMKEGSVKRKFDSIKDQINDPNFDTFDVLEQCIKHIEKPFRTSAQAEYAVLDNFMSAIRTSKKKGDYSLEEAKQEIQKYREKNDNILIVNVPAHMEDRISQMSEIMRNQGSLPSSMQDKLGEIYGNFVESMEIVSPLYGDDPALDKKLDNVIGKLIDQFENDFYHEMLVKDHVDANRIAEYYGVESEYDRWEAGEYSVSILTRGGRQVVGVPTDSYFRDKVKEGNIRDMMEVMRINTPPSLEEKVLDADEMDGVELIDFCGKKLFKTQEDYNKAYNYYNDMSRQKNKRLNFRKSDSVKVSVFLNDSDHRGESYHLIEESFKEAKRNNNDDTWKKYEDFVQEVERLEKFPSNGLRSNVQKTAIIKKLHNEIMQGKQEGMGYLSGAPSNTENIAKQLYRDSMKDKITDDKLSAIDNLI